MKKLFAILLLLITPAAYGQVDYTNAINVNQVILNPELNNCTPGAPTCGAWMEGGGWVTGDFNEAGFYTFSYQLSSLFQDIDLSVYNTTATQLFFSFALSNTCRNSIGGYCENPEGPIDYFSAKAYAYNIDNALIGEATFLNGEIATEGWQYFGFFTSFESQLELSRIRIEFTGYDVGYWAGYYGPSVDSINATLRYTSDQDWTRISGEYEQFILAEDTVVRYGANGTYSALYLTAGTYECGNGLFGDPIGGVVKSCEIVDTTTDSVNCDINPANPTCIIDSITNDAVDETVLVDTGFDSGSDDGSDDGTDTAEEEAEELLAAEEVFEETDLEQLLEDSGAVDEEVLVADELLDEEDELEKVAEPAATSSIAALADESKANELSDSISKSVLEGVLSIAADATSAGSSSSQTSSGLDSSSSRTSSGGSSSSSTLTAQESTSSETKTEEAKQESSDSSAGGLELLETGRQLGAATLATTLADTASSAAESINQAESISAAAADVSSTAVAGLEIRTDSSASAETAAETEIVATVTENAATTDDGSFINEQFVTNDQSNSEQTGSFADIMNLEIAPVVEQADADLEFVQQLAALAAQQNTEDNTNNSGFNEAEAVTIANDPALANAFNLAPNVANLELTGVLGQKQEEKSDAEKRADEVVAANAKEQEEINKNYMDADQSGIVAAMGADTDVGAYRSAMLQDNNTWYKPEDIYRNVVYKDNVRGAYFLEKGNTDTYKKMVEEQYK